MEATRGSVHPGLLMTHVEVCIRLPYSAYVLCYWPIPIGDGPIVQHINHDQDPRTTI